MKKYFLFLLVSFIFAANAQDCPEINNSTINNSNTATVCAGDTLTVSSLGVNLIGGNSVNWYQGTTPDFNPYQGQGVLLGTSTVPNNGGVGCPTVCPDLLAIFINSCNGNGEEYNNEFFILSSGSGFAVNDLVMDFDTTNNVNQPGSLGNNDINIGADACQLQTPSTALIDSLRKGSCNPTNIIPLSPGDIVPPGALVYVFTSNNVSVNYDLTDICNDGKVVYILQSGCERTQGAFTNSASCSNSNRYRKQILQLKNCNCTDELVYDRCGMINSDGEYSLDPEGDTATVADNQILIGDPPCNGPNFDQLPIVDLPLELKFVANDSLCNKGVRYIKAIISPTPGAPCGEVFSQTLTFQVVCPDVMIQPEQPEVCSGGSPNIQLTSRAPNATFTWTAQNIDNVNGASNGTGNVINQSLTLIDNNTSGSVEYVVTASANGCTSVADTVKLIVNKGSAVSLDIEGDPDFCFGGSTVLTATAGLPNYTWSNGATTQSIEVTESGTYTVTVTDAGCSTSLSTQVTELEPLKVDIIGNEQLCKGATALLYITGEYASILWNTGSDNDSIEITQQGLYSVTVSDGECFGSDSILVVSNDKVVDIIGDLNICVNGSTVLTATQGFDTYLWSNGATTQGITANSAGIYTVTATSGSCTSVDRVTVSEGSPQSINISGNLTICAGQTTQLTATEGFSSYAWSNGATTQSINVGVGTYTVNATDTNGCAATASATVSLKQLNINITQTGITCSNNTDASITVSNVSGGSLPYTYSIDGQNFQENPVFLGLAPGTYTVTAKDNQGCTVSTTATITTISPVQVNLGEDQTIEDGESVQLNAIVTGAQGNITYEWSPTTSLSCNECNNPVANPEGTTTYVVVVEDDNGCTATDTIVLRFDIGDGTVFIPNSFTPNGDNMNDIIKVLGGADIMRVKQFIIFNRWGEMVFSQENFPPNNNAYGWNGYFKGKVVPIDSYAYFCVIEFRNGSAKEYKGHINVLR